MPIHNTEEVFNEWGAVIKKQDEIDQEIQRREFEKNKVRQLNYKQELDRQRYEVDQRRAGGTQETRMREEMLMQAEKDRLDQKYKNDEDAAKAKLQKEHTDAIASLNQMNELKRQQNQMKQLEQNIYKQKVASDTQNMLNQQ